jgi:hypothetical protein
MTVRWFNLGLCLVSLGGLACENQGAGVGDDFIDETCALQVEATQRMNCPNALPAAEVERTCQAQQMRVLERCGEELRASDTCFTQYIEDRVESKIVDAGCDASQADCVDAARQAVFTNANDFECTFDQAHINATGNVGVIREAGLDGECWAAAKAALTSCSAGF